MKDLVLRSLAALLFGLAAWVGHGIASKIDKIESEHVNLKIDEAVTHTNIITIKNDIKEIKEILQRKGK